jgi:hypothetical protein
MWAWGETSEGILSGQSARPQEILAATVDVAAMDGASIFASAGNR